MVAQPDPLLILVDSPDRHAYPLPEGVTRIGRHEENDLQLSDTSISREHCYLLREGPVVRVYDSNSRNRTRIGARRVSAVGQVLDDGQLLTLGRTKLLFRGSAVPPVPTGDNLDDTRDFDDVTDEESSNGITRELRAPPPPESPPRDAPQPRGAHPRIRVATGIGASRPGRSILLSVALLVVLAVSTVGGVYLGHALVTGSGMGALDLSNWWPAGSAASGGAERGVAERLRRVEERLVRQEERLASMLERMARREEELNRLPIEVQREIEFYQRGASAEPSGTIDGLRGELRKLREDLTPGRGGHGAKTNEARLLTLEDLGLAGASEREPSPETVIDHEAPSAGGPGSENRGRATAVDRSAGPPRDLSDSQVDDLVESLFEVVDDFGNPSLTESDLEPELGTLVSGAGRYVARGALRVYDRIREMMEGIDKNMDYLGRRNESLLRKARKLAGETPEGSTTREGYGPRDSGHEEEQRLLELSRKKIEILENQKARLLRLRGAVLAALAHLRDANATRYFAERFDFDDDRALRLGLLDVLAAARASHAVPELTAKLTHPDDDLRTAVRRTLVAIVGEDLGETAGPWRQWWREHRQAQ